MSWDKQKTEEEMGISDWRSDVSSADIKSGSEERGSDEAWEAGDGERGRRSGRSATAAPAAPDREAAGGRRRLSLRRPDHRQGYREGRDLSRCHQGRGRSPACRGDRKSTRLNYSH